MLDLDDCGWGSDLSAFIEEPTLNGLTHRKYINISLTLHLIIFFYLLSFLFSLFLPFYPPSPLSTSPRSLSLSPSLPLSSAPACHGDVSDVWGILPTHLATTDEESASPVFPSTPPPPPPSGLFISHDPPLPPRPHPPTTPSAVWADYSPLVYWRFSGIRKWGGGGGRQLGMDCDREVWGSFGTCCLSRDYVVACSSEVTMVREMCPWIDIKLMMRNDMTELQISIQRAGGEGKVLDGFSSRSESGEHLCLKSDCSCENNFHQLQLRLWIPNSLPIRRLSYLQLE